MRKLNLLAAALVVFGAGSLTAPAGATAVPVPTQIVPEALWGYCCTAQGVKCCSRGGCEVNAGGCVRL